MPAAIHSQEDLSSRAHAAPDGSGDLRLSEPAPEVLHWRLSHPQPEACSFSLHFHVPTEVMILEVQPIKRLAAENAHGTQIGERNMPDLADQQSGQPISEALHGSQGAGLRLPQDPRANDHVPFAVLE